MEVTIKGTSVQDKIVSDELRDIITNMIISFNESMELGDTPNFPSLLTDDQFVSRHDMLIEEVEELYASGLKGNINDMADAFTDIMFVAASGLVLMGIDPFLALAEVSASNLTKIPGSTNRSGTDAVKADDYEEPDWSWVRVNSVGLKNRVRSRLGVDKLIDDIFSDVVANMFGLDGSQEECNDEDEEMYIERDRAEIPGIAEALRIRETKQQDYGPPSEYAPYGLKSFLHEIHKKALRAVNISKQLDRPNHEGMLDTLVDIINWADFAYKMIEEGEDVC